MHLRWQRAGDVESAYELNGRARHYHMDDTDKYCFFPSVTIFNLYLLVSMIFFFNVAITHVTQSFQRNQGQPTGLSRRLLENNYLIRYNLVFFYRLLELLIHCDWRSGIRPLHIRPRA